MSKIIKLGTYKNIEVKVPAAPVVTDQQVETEIEGMMANQTSLQDKEGLLENGDVATYDFEGFKDGVPFDGGKADGFQLEIGSGQFIPGFEAQMVGMAKGESRDLNVTFPENYPAENLAGAPVVFKVTLHNISTKVQAELTDDYIATLNIPEVTTVDAFKAYVRQYLESEANRSYTINKENHIFDALIADCEVEVEEADKEKAMNGIITHMEVEMQSQGFTLDQYLQMMGMTMEDYKAQLEAPAKQQATFEAIIDEIVAVENIETTDEEVKAQAEIIAQQNGIPVEVVFDRVKPEAFKRDINRLKASQLIITNAKVITE